VNKKIIEIFMSVIEEVTAKDIKLYKNSPKAHLADNKIIVKISPQFYCDLESVGFDFKMYINEKVYFQADTNIKLICTIKKNPKKIKLRKENKYDNSPNKYYNFSIQRDTLVLESANLKELLKDKKIKTVEIIDD